MDGSEGGGTRKKEKEEMIRDWTERRHKKDEASTTYSEFSSETIHTTTDLSGNLETPDHWWHVTTE